MSRKLSIPPAAQGLLQRLLIGLLVVVWLLLGLLFGALLIGLGLVLALVVAARLWWLRRRRPHRPSGTPRPGEDASDQGEWIEAEYEAEYEIEHRPRRREP